MLLIYNLIFPWMLLLVSFYKFTPRRCSCASYESPLDPPLKHRCRRDRRSRPRRWLNIVLLMMLNSTNSDRRRRRCAAARRYHHRCHRRLQKVGVRLAFSYYVIKNDPPWLHLRRSYCRRVWCGPFKCPKVGGRLRNALERRHSQTDLLIIVTMYAEFWIF